MFRKLLFAALVVLVLPLSWAQAGARVGIGIGVPVSVPAPYYGPSYRPYYTPYFYPYPTFYAAPPVYTAPVPIYMGLGQPPVYFLPQSQTYPQPSPESGVVQPPYATPVPQN